MRCTATIARLSTEPEPDAFPMPASLQTAIQQRQHLRETGQTLVFTNGHFDLLHVGHLDYLEKARALGDALFVAINDDPATEVLKGTGRPIVPAVERARMVAALKPVTLTLIFTGNTADDVLTALQPDIYVKGGDYAHKHLPERATVEGYGGTVQLIDYLPDHSTTRLIERIRALPL
ncbi:MAG: adenylyltransferase/cytidyltransferase family protein [Chloroflexota bacterium]